MKLEISKEERQQILTGLQMRIAYIETGNPAMRAVDARNCGRLDEIRPLSSEQYAAIVEHEKLIQKLFNLSSIR